MVGGRVYWSHVLSGEGLGYPEGVGYTPFTQKGHGTRDTLPPPQWTDKHLWKHYLLATSLAGGNKWFEVFRFSKRTMWLKCWRLSVHKCVSRSVCTRWRHRLVTENAADHVSHPDAERRPWLLRYNRPRELRFITGIFVYQIKVTLRDLCVWQLIFWDCQKKTCDMTSCKSKFVD